MDLSLFILGFALIGCFAGFLGGLFGVGGGIFVVPSLVIGLKGLGLPTQELMHIAIGTSLSSMVFNSLNSALCHKKHETIEWDMVRTSLFPLIIGCFLGAAIGHLLPTDILSFIFGIFAFILSFHFLFQKNPPIVHVFVPSNTLFKTTTTLIASLSNILGIGGGVMTVPFLSRFYMSLKNAIGTSSVLTLLITFLGAFFYLVLGIFSERSKEPHTLGFIYIPAFVTISITSFFTARYGSYISIILPRKRMERYFGCFLLLVGIFMTCMPYLLRLIK